MYEEHFGLTARPFGETAAPAAFLALPSREAAVRRLLYGLEHGQGAALLFGPPGSGKTLAARVVARELGGPSAHLTFPAMPADELLDYLAGELGAGSAPGTPTVAGALRRLRPWLADAVLRGAPPLLVVDEAHLIASPAAFECLRALLNFATLGPPDLRLLLVGAPELLLHLPPGLNDRLTARAFLGPFTSDETALYLVQRLAAAGRTRPLFPPDTLPLLHQASDGLPRRLNRLADLALLIAYAEGASAPSPRAVALAAREIGPDSDLDLLVA